MYLTCTFLENHGKWRNKENKYAWPLCSVVALSLLLESMYDGLMNGQTWLWLVHTLCHRMSMSLESSCHEVQPTVTVEYQIANAAHQYSVPEKYNQSKTSTYSHILKSQLTGSQVILFIILMRSPEYEKNNATNCIATDFLSWNWALYKIVMQVKPGWWWTSECQRAGAEQGPCVLDLGGLGGMVSLSLALACLRAAKSDNMPCFLLDCSAGKMLMQLQRKLHKDISTRLQRKFQQHFRSNHHVSSSKTRISWSNGHKDTLQNYNAEAAGSGVLRVE